MAISGKKILYKYFKYHMIEVDSRKVLAVAECGIDLADENVLDKSEIGVDELLSFSISIPNILQEDLCIDSMIKKSLLQNQIFFYKY